MLGTHIHPDHLLRDLTDEEWQGWLWYMGREPFGFPVLDMWHGLLCATFISPYLKKGATADPYDFMLRRPPQREMSPAQTEAMLDVMLRVRTSKQD